MPPVHHNILSDYDQSVLHAIFNPLENATNLSGIYEEDLPEELQDPDEIKTPIIVESIDVETQAVKAAEQQNYDEALALFQKAIDLAPHRASIYNNRAQTYRLIQNDEAALADLEEALKRCQQIGQTACKAYCQRGLLRRKQNDLDGAKEDFTNAAKLGSKFARSQLVEINPYAALCNQMLRDVFQKLQ